HRSRTAPASSSLISGSRTMISAVTSPIVPHEVAGPLGLEDRAARGELDHERLHVEHRCAVERVEAADAELEAVDVHQLTPAVADAVRAALGVLGEDAHRRPVRVPARTARAAGHPAL